MRSARCLALVCLALLLVSQAAHAKYEFEGVLEQMPGYSFYGVWVVSGQPVEVTPETRFEAKKGPVTLGAWVKVEAVNAGGHFIAKKIKVKRPKY
jgi:hypothetical protein